MSIVLILLLTVPLLPALLALVAPPALVKAVSFVVGIAAFVATIVLIPAATRGGGVDIGFLRVDALSAVFLLATAFLYASATTYAIGYLRDEPSTTYTRRFYLGLNVFAWSMLAAPAVNGRRCCGSRSRSPPSCRRFSSRSTTPTKRSKHHGNTCCWLRPDSASLCWQQYSCTTPERACLGPPTIWPSPRS